MTEPVSFWWAGKPRLRKLNDGIWECRLRDNDLCAYRGRTPLAAWLGWSMARSVRLSAKPEYVFGKDNQLTRATCRN